MDPLILLAYGNAAGELLVFARFAFLGILDRYKWFAIWMAFSASREFSILIATSSHLKTAAYWNLWQITEPVTLGLEVLVAFEVFDLIASSLLGLGSLGEKVLTVAVSVGIVISMALTLADWRGFSPWMFQVKRTVTLILAIAPRVHLLGVPLDRETHPAQPRLPLPDSHGLPFSGRGRLFPPEHGRPAGPGINPILVRMPNLPSSLDDPYEARR